MNQTTLDEILALGEIDKIIEALQVTSFDIPSWTDLNKQYDPLKHKIFDPAIYPIKANENGQDDFKRTPFALQELAVNRISQAMFATPAERSYNVDRDNTNDVTAVEILEEIYKTHNYIDAENIERAKMLNASCQMVTVWRVFQEPNIIKEQESKYKLSHTSYSEMFGYKIYANIDENRKLIVVSIEYEDSDENDYFDIYINGTNPKFIRYLDTGDGWVEQTELTKPLKPYPVVYAHLKQPVWGGEAGTKIVEQLEEMESFDGMYIKRNAAPLFAVDNGETGGGNKTTTTEKADDVRRFKVVGKGGKIMEVTWQGAVESLKARMDRLRNSFFEQNQIPDTSFANMIKSNTSAENKELIFADARAKAVDLGGEWQKLFYDEINVLKEFCKVMYPPLAESFSKLSATTKLKPYLVRQRKETAEYVATAGFAMSQATQVKVLGEAPDIEQEVDAINGTNNANANQGL